MALLEAADWQATEIAGQAALSGAEAADVTAVFVAGEMSGSGGVNRYSATYETAADGAITITTPAATLMAGPPAAMEQEQAYFAALEQVVGFSATADSLTLTDEQGNVLVRYEARQPTALQGTTWEALAYNNGKHALVSLAASSYDHRRVRRRRQPHGQRLGQPLHDHLHDDRRDDVDRRGDRDDEEGRSRGADAAGGGVPGGPAVDRDVLDRRATTSGCGTRTARRWRTTSPAPD